MQWRVCAVLPVSAAAAGRAAPAQLGVRAGEARRTSGAQGTMSDAGGGKKPPVEPQAGPGPGRAAGERGLSGSFPLVLKKLMENPPRETRLDKEKGKEKLEEDESAAASTMAVSASLMPPIWDKTIPYDGESFHLEYMDLDEFLLENGIPASPTHLAQNLLLPVAELEGKESASSSTASPPSSSTAIFQPSETVSSTGW